MKYFPQNENSEKALKHMVSDDFQVYYFSSRQLFLVSFLLFSAAPSKMITSGKVHFPSFWAIGKSDFSESDHFHGFAFSDRCESISDWDENICDKIFPRNVFSSTKSRAH